MPSRNSLKEYRPDAYYHLYNRGVDKRIIFTDDIDYKVFLSNLKSYLSPPPTSSPKSTDNNTINNSRYQHNNFHNQITLIAFCLMPNHFHLLVHQKDPQSINYFMRSLATKYVSYFNKRHDRTGHLFQGRYKASHVNSEPYLLHLTRYIHLNPLDLSSDINDTYSSYRYYLSSKCPVWVDPFPVLGYFNSNLSNLNSYKQFIESETTAIDLPNNLTLDD